MDVISAKEVKAIYASLASILDQRWFVYFSLSLLIVIIPGNVLTILAVRLSHKLRAVTSNHFVVNLACSDLLVGLALLYRVLIDASYRLGANKYICILCFVMLFFARCASFFNVMAIALDRWLAIVYPFQYAKIMTGRVVLAAVVTNWCLAALVSSVPLYWNCYEGTSACEFFTVFPSSFIFNILTPIFLIVWFVIVRLYWKIWKEVKSHMNRSIESGLVDIDTSHRKSNQTILLTLGCFSLHWLPYITMDVAQLLNLPSCKPSASVYHAVLWIAVCSSAINPLIYAWKNPGFRQVFLRLIKLKAPHGSAEYNSSFKRYQFEQQQLAISKLEDKVQPEGEARTVVAEVHREDAPQPVELQVATSVCT